LLNTYPELSDFIGRSEDGLLSIKTEGWNIIIGKQLEAFSSSSAAQLALGIEKTMTEYEEITRTPLEEYENEDVR
jgi:hypothetical protein